MIPWEHIIIIIIIISIIIVEYVIPARISRRAHYRGDPTIVIIMGSEALLLSLLSLIIIIVLLLLALSLVARNADAQPRGPRANKEQEKQHADY